MCRAADFGACTEVILVRWITSVGCRTVTNRRDCHRAFYCISGPFAAVLATQKSLWRETLLVNISLVLCDPTPWVSACRSPRLWHPNFTDRMQVLTGRAIQPPPWNLATIGSAKRLVVETVVSKLGFHCIAISCTLWNSSAAVEWLPGTYDSQFAVKRGFTNRQELSSP